jgi:hypothetical protein
MILHFTIFISFGAIFKEYIDLESHSDQLDIYKPSHLQYLSARSITDQRFTPVPVTLW